MANSRNDDMDRIGNRNTPQTGTSSPPQAGTTNTPQGRDNMDRDRGFEEGRNITNPGRTDTESFNRDRGTIDTDREDLDRGNQVDRGTDSSRDSGRDLDDESE